MIKGTGCLLRAGCALLAAVVAAVLLVALLWGSITAWDAEADPWKHIPPETLWAVHVHDVKTMGGAAYRDAGVYALIESRLGGDEAARVFRSCGRYGFFHRAVAPNTVVAGATSRDPAALYFIMQPPAWMRLAFRFAAPAPGEIAERSTPVKYYAVQDGWLVASDSREAVREVLDGWNSGTLPLGEGSGRTDAHAYAAARTSPAKPAGKTVDEAAPSHFTFADPFANVAAMRAPEPKRREPAARLLLIPENDAWNIVGEAGAKSGFQGDTPLAAVASETVGGAIPDTVPPAGRDAALYARLSDGVQARIRDEVESLTAERNPAAAHPVRALASRWLGGTLENAGTGLALFAAKPAADLEKGLPWPDIPVFTLGWTVRDGANGDAAAREFADGLSQWIAALRSPGGPLPIQSLRRAVSYRAAGPNPEDGGVVTVPPVALNGARPAWRFAGGMGWVSTDPSGLLDGGAEAVSGLKLPGSGRVSLAAGWNFGSEFVGSFTVWAADRLESMESSGLQINNASGMAADEILHLVGDIAHHFPNGALNGELDVGEEWIVFRARVGSGVR